MEEKKKRFSISLTTQILIATFGGIAFGAVIGEWAANLKFIGDIFLRLIQMSVVLLVMSAVAAAVGSGDGQDVGKMGFHTFKWINSSPWSPRRLPTARSTILSARNPSIR